MTPELLRQLTSDEFIASFAFVGTPSATRRALARRSEIASLRQALSSGAIAEATIRLYVSELIVQFRRGDRFAHEIAIAAIAVAIERRVTAFTEEFLLDLARLKLAELPLAIRVARECLIARASLTRNRRKKFIAGRFSCTRDRSRSQGDSSALLVRGVSTIDRLKVASCRN